MHIERAPGRNTYTIDIKNVEFKQIDGVTSTETRSWY
jgi:hypothetical protein